MGLLKKDLMFVPLGAPNKGLRQWEGKKIFETVIIDNEPNLS